MKPTAELPDLRCVPPDLCPPPMTDGLVAPGRRVQQVLPQYQETSVYHALYLPTDWQPGGRYPVIAEYAGNGPYRNAFGDVCTGKVSDCSLGYGISGGVGFIWVCLPYISMDRRRNQLQWWGDVGATVDYCKTAVHRVCSQYGGEPSSVLLAGFSRGAIACNYIGLHDDKIAQLWCGFVAHSHYDGVQQWGYADDDRPSTLNRLQRLQDRPQFISHEGSTNSTRRYLESTGVSAPFTFVDIPYRNHTDAWVLRDISQRTRLRRWAEQIIR